MARFQMQQSLCQSPAMFDTMFCTKRSSALLQSQPVPACFSDSLPSAINYNSRHIRIIAVYRGDWNGRVPSGCNSFTLCCGCSVSGQFFPRRPRHLPSRSFIARGAVDDTTSQVSEPTEESEIAAENGKSEGENGAAGAESFPTGDIEFRKIAGWQSFVVKLKMLIALPWQRVKKGSIFKLKLSGDITEQLQGAFSQGMSLPQICQNIVKAAHDPRISGMIVQIEPLACGWPKIDEICRQIDYYKKSGKFLVAYLPVGGEKEYYLACACGEVYAPPGAYISLLGLKVQASFFGGVLEKVGVEPQIQRFGKYKSVGDLIARKDMSEANREMLTAILDDVYHNWLRRIASLRGKTIVDVENLLAEGIFETEKLKETGWITDIKYEDEIEEMLKKKLGLKEDKRPKYVDYRKYSRVKEWTLGLSGGKEDIAVLRAVGNISRVQSGLATGGIASDTFVEEIRQVREAEHFKAVVLRIDSPGGDALASDLMWRELRLLAAKKPVVASMVDVAASGGYYMAMAAGIIVAESLTLTGSIGVVTGKFNLGKLYEKIGFTKEIISRGKFAELDAEQRPFRPDEADYFARSAKNAYVRFRDKAAFSRSMQIDKMEDVAQGRVWTGKAAVTHGLVDTLGGFSKAVAIAKQKAGIPAETKVKLVELSRRQRNISALLRSGLRVLMLLPSFFEILSSVKDKGQISEIQASMDTIHIEGEGLDTFPGSYGMDKDVAELLDKILNKS